MTEIQKDISLIIHLSQLETDKEELLDFGWENGDWCFVLFEYEDGDGYFDFFKYGEFLDAAGLEERSLTNGSNQDLLKILEENPTWKISWKPIEIKW